MGGQPLQHGKRLAGLALRNPDLRACKPRGVGGEIRDEIRVRTVGAVGGLVAWSAGLDVCHAGWPGRLERLTRQAVAFAPVSLVALLALWAGAGQPDRSATSGNWAAPSNLAVDHRIDSPRRQERAVCCLGVSAFLAQLVLMRELLCVFAGNELVLGIVLGNWMLLTGLGAWLG